VRLDLVAYASDCLISGSLELASGRLSDLLAGTDGIELASVHLRALDDGRVVELASLVVPLDDVCLIGVGGPRGDARRRVRMVARRFEMSVGPYEVVANLHTLPTADPLASMRHRARIVLMTGAVVEFDLAGIRMTNEIEVIGVNRDHVRHLRALQSSIAAPLVMAEPAP
jgi:hypothetical protein